MALKLSNIEMSAMIAATASALAVVPEGGSIDKALLRTKVRSELEDRGVEPERVNYLLGLEVNFKLDITDKKALTRDMDELFGDNPIEEMAADPEGYRRKIMDKAYELVLAKTGDPEKAARARDAIPPIPASLRRH